MSSDDEKAAIQARLYDCIKRKEPGWQEESLGSFLLKASGVPGSEYEIGIERMTRGAPPATPPVIYLPGARSAVIGKDIEKGGEIAIGDEERCGGMYILGQPRTGKSNLLVSLALNDVKNGCGILFIDPHTDAITALNERIPDYRRKDLMFLDPTKKDTSFGINLLECADNPLSVEGTWARVKDIFVKVWGDERGQLGIWLEKILRNCVYLLVDNPTYTLVDIPLILDEDTAFRNFLLGNVESNPYIEDFWFSISG
jgi:hypothetical protein